MTETREQMDQRSPGATADGAGEFAARLLSADRRRRWRLLSLRIVLGVGAPVVGLSIWQILAVTGHVDRVFFPPPGEVFGHMVDLLTSSDGLRTLAHDLGVTMRDYAIALALGCGIGFAFGIWLGVVRRVYFAFGPLMYAIYPLPKIVLYPIALALFSVGSTSTISLAALGVFYTVAISTLAGVRASSQLYHEVGEVFSLARRTYFTRIVFPAAWPSVMTGLRISIGECLVTVIAIEFISATGGIGVYIWSAWEQLAVGQMFVGLVVMGLVGGLLTILGSLLERWSSPWRRDD